MIPHDIFSMESAKAAEYGIAVAFMLLFIPFWRYVQGRPAPGWAEARAPRLVPRLVEWFALPERLFYHPGHSWARVEPDGVVTVGLDDFAARLVGPLAGVRLPAVGTRVGQGEPAWALLADGKRLDMVSPVDGVVLEANMAGVEPGRSMHDPYEAGWLLRVAPSRLHANLRSLLTGEVARRWMTQATDALRARLTPQLGLAYQDGGTPIDGIARQLAGAQWDLVAREFLLTGDAGQE